MRENSEGGREGGREEGRREEGGSEGGSEGGREGVSEGGREGGREGGEDDYGRERVRDEARLVGGKPVLPAPVCIPGHGGSETLDVTQVSPHPVHTPYRAIILVWSHALWNETQTNL